MSKMASIYRARAGVILLDRAREDLVAGLIGMNRLRPFETGPVGTSGGTARINPADDVFCNGAAGSVCFTLPNGASVNLGGAAVGSPAVALGQNNNETSIFIVGTDHALYTRRQTAATTNSSVFNPEWVNLGGYLTSNPIALRNCNGVMEVFARGKDNAVWTTWQNEPGGTWHDWATLGGIAHSRPTVSTNGCDVTVSVVGADGRIWNKRRTQWVWGDWELQ